MSERVIFSLTTAVWLLLLAKAAAQDAAPKSSGWPNGAPEGAVTASNAPSSRIWSSETGVGFERGAQEAGLVAGVGLGMKALGGGHFHNWTLGAAQYGYVLSDPVLTNHWYRGNWELLGEAFGSEQFHPDAAYLAGAAPLLRYNFAASRQWVPFIDGGGGLCATDIRNGDLSTTFEFNLQGAAGVRIFLSDSLALTLQYRYMHVSNASTHSPNLGVNVNNALAGLTWLF
jgi:opacity protein-like surface antigen